MSIRSSLLSFSAQRYIGFVINFATVIFIARLLTPEEIGVFSLGVGIVAIAHKFRDMGITSFIIQHRAFDKTVFQSAYGVMLTICWSIALILFLSASLFADLYDDKRLETVIHILAGNFLVLPFGAITLSILQREMQFFKVGLMNVSSQVVGSAVSIILALNGYSYASLAWGSLAGMLATVVAALLVRPGTVFMWPSYKKVREVINFGGPVTAVNLAGEASYQAPEYFLGFFQTFASIGFYSRARGQIEMFSVYVLQTISAVLFPYIAEKVRNGQEVRSTFMFVISCMTGLSWPFYIALAVMAFPIMRILFGPTWDEAIPLVQIMAAAAFVQILSPIHNSYLMATGNVKTFAKVELFLHTLNIVIIYLAAQHSLTAVALSRIPFTLVLVMIYLHIQIKLLDASWGEYIKAVFPSVKLAIFSTLPTVLLMTFYHGPDANIVVQFVVGSAFLALFWLVGVFVIKHPLHLELLKVWTSVRQKMAR